MYRHCVCGPTSFWEDKILRGPRGYGMNTVHPPQADDPSSVELVTSIIQKTQEGKLYWNKSSDGYTSQLQPAVNVTLKFIFRRQVSAPPDAWEQFTVQSTLEGNVLIVRNDQAQSVMSILSGQSNPLLTATRVLFKLVREKAEGS